MLDCTPLGFGIGDMVVAKNELGNEIFLGEVVGINKFGDPAMITIEGHGAFVGQTEEFPASLVDKL